MMWNVSIWLKTDLLLTPLYWYVVAWVRAMVFNATFIL